MTHTVECQYTADVVCVRESRRGPELLAVKRGYPPHQGKWALPGGFVEPNETARAAATRELLEETGVKVPEERLIFVTLADDPDRDPRGRYVSAVWCVVVDSTTEATAGSDAAETQWLPLADPGELAFDHQRLVQLASRDQLRWLWHRIA